MCAEGTVSNALLKLYNADLLLRTFCVASEIPYGEANTPLAGTQGRVLYWEDNFTLIVPPVSWSIPRGGRWHRKKIIIIIIIYWEREWYHTSWRNRALGCIFSLYWNSTVQKEMVVSLHFSTQLTKRRLRQARFLQRNTDCRIRPRNIVKATSCWLGSTPFEIARESQTLEFRIQL